MPPSPPRSGRAAGPLFLFLLLTLPSCAHLEPIRVSPDHRKFELARSHKVFTPYGLNYGHHGQLIEDLWSTDWPAIEHDFAAMKAMGTSVVRVHLQFSKFMDAPDRPNLAALQKLRDLLALAERTGLYLDLTGLACYRVSDVPAWYDTLDEKRRWAAQAEFWKAVAITCRRSPAVFCYDLMNEPIVPGGHQERWYTGQLGGYSFLQYLTLDPGSRQRADIAHEWVRLMTATIRRQDPQHLITIGMLPWDPKWHFLAGLEPARLAPDVDFISVHIYPNKGKVNEAMEGLQKFAVGKPVVIEETFPLYCSINEERNFLLQSRQYASGWLGHFDGDSIEDLRQLKRENKIDPARELYLAWEEMMVELKGKMLRSKGPQ